MRSVEADDRGAHRLPLCEGEHPLLLSLLTGVLSEGDVFVDVGANRGMFAVPIAKTVGSVGHVHAFEPAPDVVEQLRTAARAHGVGPIISIHQMALGSRDGSTDLRADPEYPEDSTKRSSFMPKGHTVATVPLRSFDALIDGGVIAAGIDAVKIDVEGAEMHVLAGMRKTLERFRPRMVVVETIESHLRRAGSGVAELHAFMRRLGYAEDGRASGLELNAVFVRSRKPDARSDPAPVERTPP